MKVLFLDIDGVLNSKRSAVAFNKFPWDVKPEDIPLFDLVAVALIRKVCKETHAKIVLSSTWRHTVGWERVGQALDLPIIDATPTKINGKRGHEIEMWLERQCTRHPELQTTGITYAIVDDDSDMLEAQRPFFVQTDGENGLTLANYDALVKILGKI
ncbi:MAG: hypothetical protein MOGMAGMI_02312 [Candidatus Omnitrophica bacterium]|nr:hypothetical protein [Candidatus Omnitrophota bacterium]